MSCTTRALRQAVLVLVCTIAAVPWRVAAHADVLAVAWLESNQSPSGLWGEDKQTPYRDAAVVVDVLARLGADSMVVTNGFSAVYGTATSSTDYLARKIMAAATVNNGYVSSDLLDSLAAMQNDYGGWGYQKGYGSNVLETALALRALKSTPGGCIVCLGAGMSSLLSQQNTDGGWSFVDEGSSLAFFTAHAILTLALLVDDYDVATPLQNGVDWLVTQANPDGGFGDGGVSNPYETGLALAAIAEVNPLAPAVTSARSYLESTQLPNGSWNDDAYCTALALYGISHSLGIQGRSVALSPGMNLLGLPVEPLTPVTSDDILPGIPGCTEIKGWDRVSQNWLTGDFPVNIQDGFFAHVPSGTDMVLLGTLPEENQCTMLELGLNAISIPNENACYTAIGLIEDVNDCQEVHKWDQPKQKWISLVKTSGDTLRGEDFSADPGNGYFVRVNTSSQWCTEVCDTITPPRDSLPDLVLWSDLIMIEPNPVSINTTVFIGAALYNAGTDTAFTPTLDFFFGDPDAGGVFFAARDVPEDIPPESFTGYFYGFSMVFPDPFVSDIYVIADYCNVIAELNETNNKAYQTLEVVGPKAAPTGTLVDENNGTSQLTGSSMVRPGEKASIPLQVYQGRSGAMLSSTGSDGTRATVIKKVNVGSLTSSSATITWVSDDFAFGCINYGTSSPSDYSECAFSFSALHCVELEHLLENTTYYYEVVCGDTVDDNGGAYYSFTTTIAGAGVPSILYGRVLDSNSVLAPGVIVSLTINHGSTNSYPLTILTDWDGTWTMNLGNLKSQSANDVLTYDIGDEVYISVEGGSNGVGYDTILVSGSSPQDAGTITLQAGSYICGDADGNGTVEITDAVFLIAYIFVPGAPAPDPIESADVDCDGEVIITDAVYLIAHIFVPGSPPPCDTDNDGEPDC